MKLKEQETNRIQIQMISKTSSPYKIRSANTFNKITSANIRLLMRNVVSEITYKKTNS